MCGASRCGASRCGPSRCVASRCAASRCAVENPTGVEVTRVAGGSSGRHCSDAGGQGRELARVSDLARATVGRGRTKQTTADSGPHPRPLTAANRRPPNDSLSATSSNMGVPLSDSPSIRLKMCFSANGKKSREYRRLSAKKTQSGGFSKFRYKCGGSMLLTRHISMGEVLMRGRRS